MNKKANTGIWIIAVLAVVALIVGGILLFSGNTSENTGNSGSDTNTRGSNTPITTPTTPEPGITEQIPQKTYNVEVSNFAFLPSTLIIKRGDKIVWTNQDSVSHTVTSDSGSELNSELLSKEQTYSHIFNNAGTFDYHCTPHPYMKATIIVE